MDKIQFELCKLGRRDLAQLYYFKIAEQNAVPRADIVEKDTFYATKCDGMLFVHFKRVPGLGFSTYGYIKEIVEKFYSTIYPRMLHIKEVSEKMGAESAVVPIADCVLISTIELSITMSIVADNLLINQLIAVLDLNVKN